MNRSGSEGSGESNMPVDPDAEAEEKHFRSIINAFRYYRTHSMRRLLLAEKYFDELPDHHKVMLPLFRDNLKRLRICIYHNYEILKLIIADADHLFENTVLDQDEDTSVWPANERDMEKISTVLKQIVRDWAVQGEPEREACYAPVLKEIAKYFPKDKYKTEDVHVLVPGAGLGRLAFEIAKLGYSCQGNEFSYFMLITSNFILNRCKETNLYVLYPWIHQFCNNILSSDQTSPIQFPDVNPNQLNPDVNFSMAAGDFLEVYTDPDCWDCVATVFFIDTAHNILAYIETIYKILKPGGIWINFGPLLYHFADLINESSIELSYEDLRDVIKKFNFVIETEEINLPASYTQNPKSMLRYQYNCVFFVALYPDSKGFIQRVVGAFLKHPLMYVMLFVWDKGISDPVFDL